MIKSGNLAGRHAPVGESLSTGSIGGVQSGSEARVEQCQVRYDFSAKKGEDVRRMVCIRAISNGTDNAANSRVT